MFEILYPYIILMYHKHQHLLLTVELMTSTVTLSGAADGTNTTMNYHYSPPTVSYKPTDCTHPCA